MFTSKDNFLSARAFEALRDRASEGPFEDVTSPADGVTYPNICTDVPDIVRKEVEFLAGKPAKYLFLRRSPAGTYAPQQAHTDNVMARSTFMLYLDDPPPTDVEHGSAPLRLYGTSFLRHRVLGIAYAPAVQELVDLCRADENNVNAWALHSFCSMRANRSCIFDSGFFHRAEPIGGYGQEASARTVLAGFFD